MICGAWLLCCAHCKQGLVYKTTRRDMKAPRRRCRRPGSVRLAIGLPGHATLEVSPMVGVWTLNATQTVR